jgi:hypothetical protein
LSAPTSTRSTTFSVIRMLNVLHTHKMTWLWFFGVAAVNSVSRHCLPYFSRTPHLRNFS